MRPLIEFRSNTYSQNGEDGVLSELLQRLGMDNQGARWCVEFGAWDGKYLSNTFALVEHRRWNAVYIEADEERFQQLQRTARKFPTISPVHSLVGGDDPAGRSLDSILRDQGVPNQYDVLSIDIDSTDLEVWALHLDFSPAVVIIEIESTIPPGIMQWHSARHRGNSFSATLCVAKRKGYELVCHTGNMFFVRADLIERVGLNNLDRDFPERLFVSDWVLSPAERSLKARARRTASRLPKRVRDPIKRLLHETA